MRHGNECVQVPASAQNASPPTRRSCSFRQGRSFSVVEPRHASERLRLSHEERARRDVPDLAGTYERGPVAVTGEAAGGSHRAAIEGPRTAIDYLITRPDIDASIGITASACALLGVVSRRSSRASRERPAQRRPTAGRAAGDRPAQLCPRIKVPTPGERPGRLCLSLERLSARCSVCSDPTPSTSATRPRADIFRCCCSTR